ncbi:DUF2510 domain-containing protein [Agromyces sp. G08B096]|uniref:DUF2510 domain-containing protein n=1 Tax=Agromyces sp. G08B096 TaxID=3156399 RepID=A0AAU7W4W4_9MICO
MTDGTGQQIAAGWYPDPAGSGGQRWWDGTGWTSHVAPPVVAPASAAAAPAAPVAPPAPAAPAAQPYRPELVGGDIQVPASTPTGTVWIWLLIFVPLVSLLPLFLWDPLSSMSGALTQPYAAPFATFLDPGYLLITGLSWVVYGVSVWFAFLDSAALARLGYARRFHWAWTFLSSLVYVIGRSVVVRRQAGGRGLGPLWTVVAVNVAAFCVSIVWIIWVTVRIFEFSMASALTTY